MYTLAAASLLIALICAVVPAQGTAQIKLLCSLCVVCLICAPVVQAVRALGSGELIIPDAWIEQEEQESGREQDYEQLAQSMLAGQLQVLLERDMQLTPEQCRIFAEWGDGGEVVRITLVLSGKAIWRDPDPIKEYVQTLMGCPCTVVLD